ncbi:MAG: TIGR04255 family protein [Rhodocyclaceae bacterium]|nr:TIGR04255 family protein [Rhodocyclaceae bacterium]
MAQVRFNPILKLADFLPSIQESFRQAGYPDFDRQHIISIQLTAQEGQPPTPTPSSKRGFSSATSRKRTSLSSTADPHAPVPNYGQFETFSACFLEGLSIVERRCKARIHRTSRASLS